MIKFLVQFRTSSIPKFGAIAVLNSTLSLLMATVISRLFNERIFIEFYATLNASLLGITLSQFGLGNVILAFRNDDIDHSKNLVATWSVFVTPILVSLYLLLLSVYLNFYDVQNIDIVAVGFYVFGRSNWLLYQSRELIFRSFRSVFVGLVIQVVASLILFFVMYIYDMGLNVYFIGIGSVSFLVQLLFNRSLPKIRLIKFEYLSFASKNVLNSVLITFFTIGDKILANSMLLYDQAKLSDYYNASIVIGYFYFVVNIFSNWWGSVVSENWTETREIWCSSLYFKRNLLWLSMLIPIIGVLFLSSLYFRINQFPTFILTGLVLGLNLSFQAMMKFTQGIILMHRDMRTILTSTLLGIASFVVIILLVDISPGLLLSVSLCLSSVFVLMYHVLRIKGYDF